jgi:hypothetical protein
MRCFILFTFVVFSFYSAISYAEGLFQYKRIDFFKNVDTQENARQTASNETPEIIVDDWAEPIINPSGRISIYLPPKEVRDFLDNPDSQNAKAYLEWNSRRIKKFIAARDVLRKEAKEIETMKETKSSAEPKTVDNHAGSVSDNKPRANYLFYFMRKGCGFCAKQTPIIEDIYLNHPEIEIEAFAKGFSNKELSRFKFPVMQDSGMSRLLKITSYPAMAIFNKRKERYLLTGFTEKERILKLFE